MNGNGLRIFHVNKMLYKFSMKRLNKKFLYPFSYSCLFYYTYNFSHILTRMSFVAVAPFGVSINEEVNK